MGVAETYADYMPSKLKLGRKHPDPVVETASLSSVAPADVWYKLSIPSETINTGQLSALQLESITYASQAHEHILPDGSRAGFLIGDGAGVGKGRTIAGIIFENYLKGRKRAIWVSVSNDLKYDAERDLRDIGAGKIEVHPLNKFKYAKISSAINGNVKKGVIFSTYSALIGESNSAGGKYKSRLKQLLQWCGPDFDGLIIFDECHRAKNLCPVGSSKPTKTGKFCKSIYILLYFMNSKLKINKLNMFLVKTNYSFSNHCNYKCSNNKLLKIVKSYCIVIVSILFNFLISTFCYAAKEFNLIILNNNF